MEDRKANERAYYLIMTMAFYRSFVNQICPVLRYYVQLEEI
jgi:hypothetical protein